MSDYFSKFPIINYNGVNVRDISRRIAFSRRNLSDPLLMLPYTVKEGEKPEHVAHLYYGSVAYTWLVLMANDIVDPYEGWPMDSETFDRYIMSKYAEESGESGYDVIAWCQSVENDANVVFFYKENERGETIMVDPDTFDGVWHATLDGWSTMRIYDYESNLNEEKRNILLVDAAYKDKIEGEFQKIILE